MKDPVTTIAQSQRLLELGVPAQKASTLWYRHKISKDTWTEWELVCGRLAISKSASSDVVPAFTIGDLLEMMPKCLSTESNEYTLVIRSLVGGGWYVYYKPVWNTASDDVGGGVGHHLIDLLIGRIEWLLANEFKLEV